MMGNIRFSNHLGRTKKSLLSGEETYLFSILRLVGKLYYIPTMQVHHFIHKERLSQEWVMKRFYAEGVSQIRIRSLKKIPNGWYGLKIFFRGVGRYFRYLFMEEKARFQLSYKLSKDKGMLEEILGRAKL